MILVPVRARDPFVCGALLVLAAGCVSANVRVVQIAPVERPRERVYIVVHEGAVYPHLATELARAVAHFLANHTSARKSLVLTGSEFDTTAVDRDVADMRSDGLLVIKPIGSRTDRYGRIIHVTWTITLHDQEQQRPIWAAKADSHSAAPDMDAHAMGLTGEKIVAALARDRMVRPAVPVRQ
jgi:hypothetical protein